MLPALLKAQELQARQDTAASIARIDARLVAIEAKLDELLARLAAGKAPQVEANRPKRKDD